MSLDLSSISTDALVWANLLVQLILPILPIIIGFAIGGFLIAALFALPKLLGKMKIG